MSSWGQNISKDKLLAAFYPGGLPNKAAALAAIILYAAATAGVIGTTVKTRAWWMLVCVVTGAVEVAGYALKIKMLDSPEYYTYVVSYAFLVIGPVFLVIVEYLCVAKLIGRSKLGGKSRFARGVAWFMTVSEVICLGIQCAAGGPLTSKDEKQREIGGKMMLAGLSMQVGFFSIFTGIALYVQRRKVHGYNGNKRFRGLFATLYTTIVLFYIRNIFRIVEFGQGFFGYLATHEEFFYIFDFVPMFSILSLFAVFNYGFWLGPKAEAAHQEADKAAASDAQAPTVDESAVNVSETAVAGKGTEPADMVVVSTE